MVTPLQNPAMATEPPGYFQRFTISEILSVRIGLVRIADSVLSHIKYQFERLILVKLRKKAVFIKKYKYRDERCSFVTVVERVIVDY